MHRQTIHLPPHDRELLKLLASGLTTTELATAMEVTAGTIQSRQRRLTTKLGLASTTDLMDFARANTRGEASQTASAREGRGTRILQTKLHPPVRIPNLVVRPRLLDRLNENERCPLTLVSAPAGYGKSTLVAQWLGTTKIRSAWLSLGAEDSDLRVFLSYLVAAVQTRYSKACRNTADLLLAPELPPLSVLTDALGNDLEKLLQPLIVVLDDYHHIHDTTVHNLLDELLRHPPRPLRLIIVTRRDPPIALAPLRARALLTEIVQADLRFSQSETEAVMRQSARLSLSQEAFEQLNDAMEGWIAGLHLLCLALKDLERPDVVLSRLGGGIQQANQFLLQEVLAQQPAAIQEYLLKTSLLDRFSASLCQAVCSGSKDSSSARILGKDFIRTIRQANLFVISLDTHGEWFRYHHLFQQLLQQTLRSSLGAEDIAQVHSRASEWFEAEGFLDEAIHHALEAGAPVRAAEIVETHRDSEFTLDRWFVVDRWLAKLPFDIRQERPKLLLTEAWIGNLQHQLARVTEKLKQAAPKLRGRKVDPVLLGEFACIEGYLGYFEGDTERSCQRLEQAVSKLSGRKSPFLGEAELMLGLARCMAGQTELAVHELEDKIDRVDSSESQRLSRLIAGLVFVHLVGGDMHRARVAAQRLQLVAEKHGMQLTKAWSSYMRACTHLHTGELAAASSHFARAIEKRYVLEPRAAVDALAGLTLAKQLLGLESEAAESAGLLQKFALELNERNYLSVAYSCQVRVALLQGDLDSARERTKSIGDPPTQAEAELFCWLEAPSITQARALAATGTEDSLNQAAELLQTVWQQSTAARFTCQMIEVAVLQSLVLEMQGRSEKALNALERALALGEPGRWIRPFIELGAPMVKFLQRALAEGVHQDFVRTLLGAAQKHRPRPSTSGRASTTVQPLIEPLTNRELDVLELVVQRLQDKEMADRLSVSPQTIKAHLQHIYQKLGVSGRRNAARRGVELGLVSTP